MSDVANAVVTYTHTLSMMFVAVLVSIVAAFTGLALTRNIVDLPESTRKMLVTMASVVIGSGIWTMHFVAMLANDFSVPVGYDVIFTLGSGLVSILVVGVSLLVLHYTARTSTVLNVAGLILGMGIVCMHYIGMGAMRGAIPEYQPGSLLLTTMVAAIAGILAIRVAYGKRSKEHVLVGGLLLGLSVVIVHYTAMRGTSYRAAASLEQGTIAIANPTLAIVLVVVVFIICGAFLLVATTFLTRPDVQSRSNSSAASAISQQNGIETDVESKVEPTRPMAQLDDDAVSADGDNVEDALSDAEPDIAGEIDTVPAIDESAALRVRIPYERNKKILFVDSEEVGSVRADGRYTQLYTRQGVHFCPWSITEAEKRLPNAQFYRSHRSYLVNVQSLSSFEKRKDSGVCLFDDFEMITSVPVSRTRVAGLMELLGLV